MTYFTTITSKGQITLPASLRKNLNLRPGARVSVSQNDQHQLVINTPANVDQLRAELKNKLRAQGFTPQKLRSMAEKYKSGDGFTAYVKEKYGQVR